MKKIIKKVLSRAKLACIVTAALLFAGCHSSNNAVPDTTAPVITLTGADPQVITTGNAYTELGATAMDDVDGDISASIVIDASAVDTNTPASYAVTYDVSDAAGNTAATATRTVNVEDPPPGPTVIPGINPAFDTVDEIATSDSPDGPFSANGEATYDGATETVTFPDGALPAGGLYVRITGMATNGGTSASYTVYTHVSSTMLSVAATEMTSLAVAYVADGTAADFSAGVAEVAQQTNGVTEQDITAAATAAERGGALTASMMAIFNQFENGAFVPGTSDAAAANAEIGQCIALGGLVWDNMSKVDAGGTGSLPAAEPSGDYQRCKACHGWDQLGTDGGYARRSRKDTRPNAGFGDPNTVSRNISGGSISMDMVLHAGTGRSWAEGSAVFDSTAPWGPGAMKGNEHPDLSAGGVNSPEVPSAEQMRCVSAFLNHPDARADRIFAVIQPNSDPADPVPDWCTSGQCTEYTLVGSADAARGDAWYHDPAGGNCVLCHGEPEDAVGPIAPGPAGGLLAFLRQDGKYSEFAHKVRWGEAGDALMTRANMNNPTSGQVADVLAYLQEKIQVGVNMEMVELGGLAYDNMSKVDAGGTGVLPAGEPNSDYQRCKACHGWDQLGTDGGYARRSRKDTRPNAGFGDPNTVSRNISNDTMFGNGIGVISEDMVTHPGTGRSWAEGSAVFDGTAPWGPGTQLGNTHPDLSMGGVNGTDVPSAQQIAGLTAFLNYPAARIDAVFSAIDPNPATVPAWCTSAQCTDYTVVATADAARGDAWYHDPAGGNCVTCHGEPDDAVGPIAAGPAGGLLAFLRQDGKFSEFRHKVQWGEAGDPLMTRANMNNPTAADVADVLAYLQQEIQMQMIELGGLAYDNMSKVDAGGTGILPAGEPNGDYQRCKACHGWDQLGTDGGYARRSRKDTRPNAGFGDPNTVSRNISNDATFGNVMGAVSQAMVLHAGTGRSWAEGSAVFDGTAPWGPGTQLGNTHPDLSMGGVNGADVPSTAQIAGLTAFLNYPDARIDAVFAAIDPAPAAVPAWCTSAQCTDYTLVGTADAARGDSWYHDVNGGNCVTCHGEPEDAVGPIAAGPAGGLLAFLRQDGKFSEFRHKVQWGEAGDALMTRANMNDPTAADVADVLAYLKVRIDAQVAGTPIANDDTATTAQDMAVDIDVLANDSDPTMGVMTISAYDGMSANGGTINCTGPGICTYTPAMGFTGVDTFGYTVDNGTATASATVTVTVSAPGGDPAAGQARYDAECSVCHAASAYDPTVALGGNDIGNRGAELVAAGRLINNLETIDPLMVGIVLTDQEILDMVAFLDSL